MSQFTPPTTPGVLDSTLYGISNRSPSFFDSSGDSPSLCSPFPTTSQLPLDTHGHIFGQDFDTPTVYPTPPPLVPLKRRMEDMENVEMDPPSGLIPHQ
jgi:hypothetical protein